MLRLKKKTFAILSAALLIASLVALISCNLIISSRAAGKLYTDINSIPFNKTGLLLGTSKFTDAGYTNPYYSNRIDAAYRLLSSGRIKYLVISGDNSKQWYNEPADMRHDLISRGIDSNRIFLDYAGFRTFDSMVRLKAIFGQSAVTVISQPFHNERAIYIASRMGISAIGFNARDVGASADYKVKMREKLSRVKVFADFIFGTKARFLGKQISIPD